MKVILEAGWIIDQHSFLEILEVAGITQVQNDVVRKNADSKLKDVVAMKHNLDWKKLLVSVQTGKDLARMLHLEFPKPIIINERDDFLPGLFKVKF